MGAQASAKIFSMLETAKANGHHPHHYMTILLTELPNAASLEDYEALLPWALTPQQAKQKYDCYPRV